MKIFQNRYRIGKAYVSRTTPNHTIQTIKNAILKGENAYICIANMRSIIYGNKHTDYANILNNSLLTTPDGTPLVWCAKCWGYNDVKRTVGPDLFVTMLKENDNIKHFLLGDTEETLKKISQKGEYNNIVGYYSPPFCEVDEFDYKHIADLINKSNADIVWVSLRAPKQDYFAVRLLPYLNKKIVIGVGAAFRFALGQYKHPNKLIQKLGLTGIFWRKYSFTNFVKVYSSYLFYLIIYLSDITLYRLTHNTKKNEK